MAIEASRCRWRVELICDALSGLAGAVDDENGVVGMVRLMVKRSIRSSERDAPGMNKVSLTALAREHLENARAAHSGRSSHTVYGGHEHSLRQTLIALKSGSKLDDHESPGEATLHVLHGRVRVTNEPAHWEGSPGDHIVIPASRHGLQALEDSVVLLTVVKSVGPHV